MRLRIKDLEIGKSYTVPLVVTNATDRLTKTGKPYLQLEFFDGVDSINGNYWDWAGKAIPENNQILDVVCQVTEWQGTKQLNIKALCICTNLSLAEFAPSSNKDVSKTYLDAIELASSIKNDTLRTITIAAFEELKHLWLTVPGAVKIHHAYIAGTLIHSVSVAKIAKAIASAVPDANEDLCVAGALLHDIGKLNTYKMSGVIVDMTSIGKLFEHTFLGMHFIMGFVEEHVDTNNQDIKRTVDLLAHIIASHHGKLEYGAIVPPQCIEAHIVHNADAIDASCEQIRTASSKQDMNAWTDRIYTLENKSHLKPQYISDLLG